MARKLLAVFVLTLLMVAFTAATAFPSNKANDGVSIWKKRADRMKYTAYKLAGAENPAAFIPSNATGEPQSLGFDAIVSNSPGMQIGLTTYDIQSNCRMNRQVEWRATQMIHFIWMKCLDSASEVRWTTYENWDPEEADLTFEGIGGGADIHSGSTRSGYASLDVDTESKAVIANHYNAGAGWATNTWYDFNPGAGFWSPYRSAIPDSTMQYGVSQAYLDNDSWRFIWPQHEYQVYAGDTVTHVFAHQTMGEGVAQTKAYAHYFRRVGSDTVGSWDYPPMIVDTIPTIGQCVTASRSTGKVALAWPAGPGNYPGDPESVDRYERIDDGLGHAQRTSDIFCMISNDMGASWDPKFNVTAYDSSQGGWLVEGDLNALIDTDDNLHIVYTAREAIPFEGWLGDWTNFLGSRVWHWDEVTNEHRTVKDGNWEFDDSSCTGGAFNGVNLVKPMISECEGKFYVVFVQFNDGPAGLQNDCAEGGAGLAGTANGELYIAVSDNDGYNWDVARNLTNTITPHCYPHESGEGGGTPVCESDHYPSMPRFGMEVTDPDGFVGTIIVDPSGGDYTGNYYLDVLYVNDKYPGGCMQDAGYWTTNPVKWFRVPCVEPVPNPVLIYSPNEIGPPVWTKPGVQLDTTFKLENVGNFELNISSIAVINVSGPVGWLGVGTYPSVISHLSPNFATVDLYMNDGGAYDPDTNGVCVAYVEIVTDALGGSIDSMFVSLIVADTVQFPEYKDIRTAYAKAGDIRITFNNAGGIGNSGEGGYNLDFSNDCDTAANASGQDDRSDVYIYDASPFLCWVSGNDTILNYGMFDATWLSNSGFRPIVSPSADSTTYPDYQYGHTGKFLSKDSTIALECEYFFPTSPAGTGFLVSKQKIYMEEDINVSGLFVGDLLDWDIPSDSGSENGSDFDASRQLMYCFGAEYGTDTLDDGSPDLVNDCVFADQRYGGMSYYAGYKLPFCEGSESDSIPSTKAMWTEMNADYVYPTSGFVAGEMYPLMVDMSGYSAWMSSNPTMEDSLYQDLHAVTVFGQYDLKPGDTLVFVKILATEYDGGLSGLQATIDDARTWIAAHPEVFSWPDRIACGCCDVAGDANNSGSVNMLDITYLISYLYKGGPAPPCAAEGDANASGSINMLDITYLISFLYKGGPAPICGPE